MFEIFFCFSAFLALFTVKNMGKFQMFEIFPTILYQFMVAKYFHKFYIFQNSYFKESWRFAISYCFQLVWAF